MILINAVTVGLLLVAAGGLTGVLAGLFGVGGGAILVPVLYQAFGAMSVPEAQRMPLCVGTSLAVIIPTSLRSYRAHQSRGAADSSVVKMWAVPVVLGVVCGSAVALIAPPNLFRAVFVVVAVTSAARLLVPSTGSRADTPMPRGPVMRAVGFVIGLLSSLMGIGGGQLSNLFMTLYGRPIHQAVATSAGLGTLIAIPGTIGYMAAGLAKRAPSSGVWVLHLPWSVGYVSLLGFALLAPTSIWSAPLGVRWAHQMSKRKLELAFGCFLLIVSARFAYDLIP